MCGIAGIITRHGEPPATREVLGAMADALAHRGPDDSGVLVAGTVGLAHRRLSVVDLETGAQPMSIHAGTVRVVFNGEIFNHIELRQELIAAGCVFTTRSDTEVILHAYAVWGESAWKRFNGQFAFALSDGKSHATFLVRDRSGICPLMMARTAHAVVFASESRAIHATGLVEPAPDVAAINSVFRLWAADGKQTVFAGIENVLPGTAVRIGADLRVREVEYTHSQTRFDGTVQCANAPDEDETESLLTDAVRIRLRADVPVGAYLSGGLDSSLIVRLMQVASGINAQTFSLRFNDPAFDASFDEGEAQLAAASAFGVTHHQLSIGPTAIVDAMPDVVTHAETPLLRAGPVPMYLLSRFVRSRGLRVVLTGEGADEHFGGYDIFKEAKLRAFVARDPNSTWRRALVQRLHPYVTASGDGMWQHFFEGGSTNGDAFSSHAARWRNNEWTLRFLAPHVRAAQSSDDVRARLAASLPQGWESEDEVARAQSIELATFLAPYLLSSQGDRMLMAHGIEGRFPFLDPRVVDLGRRLRPSQKIIGLREKALLRRVASRVLPPAIAARRKWPFRAPLQGAFFGAHAPDYVREAFTPSSLSRCPLIDHASAAKLGARMLSNGATPSEREQMAAMGILTTTIWWQRCIEDRRRAAPRCEGVANVRATPASPQGRAHTPSHVAEPVPSVLESKL